MAKKTNVPNARGARVDQHADGRTATGRRNRQALIRAAQELFRESDYNAIGIRDIVDLAGVGVGTFYNHFKDKDDLVRRVLEDSRSASLDRQHELRAEADTFPEFITRHFKFFFQAIADEPAYMALLRAESGLLTQIVHAPAHLRGMEVLRSDLEQAMHRGILAHVDGEYLSRAIRGIAIEVGQAMMRRCPADPEVATDFAVQLILGTLPWRPKG
jgi:AcrR family transcriptional regulator